MTWRTAIIKRNIELLLMSPFVLLGKMAGYIFRLKSKHDTFLFFSSADIGGAIRVNADIVNCIKDRKPLIIFSKRPKNNEFRQLFDVDGVRVIDLHKWIDNKLYHFINFFFRGVLAAWINRSSDKPVVFGGECLFFYKVIPHVKSRARKVELCHLNTWFNFSQAFIKYIDARVFSTLKIKRDVEHQYAQNNIPAVYNERLHFIDNKIDIPVIEPVNNQELQVIFVGRGAPQKRVHLIGEIALAMKKDNRPVQFSFVGDVTSELRQEIRKITTLYGNVTDRTQMQYIYRQADVLILTSAYEGLPLAIMEMMALGKTVVSTAVDAIPDYIKQGETGLLITATDEKEIVSQGVALLNELIEKPTLKETIGNNSRAYAIKYFSGETFCAFYRDILFKA